MRISDWSSDVCFRSPGVHVNQRHNAKRQNTNRSALLRRSRRNPRELRFCPVHQLLDQQGRQSKPAEPALDGLLRKELRYVGSKLPVCSLIRLRKFIRRGWVGNAGQILKMTMQV